LAMWNRPTTSPPERETTSSSGTGIPSLANSARMRGVC
jgi:hypothetical protein